MFQGGHRDEIRRHPSCINTAIENRPKYKHNGISIVASVFFLMNMSTMLATFYKPGNDQVVLEHVAIPKPEPKEVLIKIKACGVCHSDVRLVVVCPSLYDV